MPKFELDTEVYYDTMLGVVQDISYTDAGTEVYCVLFVDGEERWVTAYDLDEA